MKKPVLTPYVRKPLQRVLAVIAAVPLVLVLAGAALVPPVSAIGGQVQSRKIVLSDNQVSGGATGGTNVSYDVWANIASAYTLKGIVVDFCDGSSSPIIGTTCTAPSGMSLGTPTFTPDTTTTNAINTTGWTAATINSGRSFALTDSTGVTTTTSSTNSILHFTITGVTNPTALGTFYARLLTYTTTAGATGYTAGSPGTYQDYGGFAMSLANPVTVTARVQESLTYCVSHLDMSGAGSGIQYASGTSCAAATTPSFVIGHGVTQSTFTIDNSEVDSETAYTQISTNASAGAVVRMKNFNTCSNAGLSSNGGSTCNIPGVAGTSIPSPSLGSVPAAISAGTSAFGLFVSNGATTTGVSTSSGTYTPDPNYNDGTHTTEPTVSTVNSQAYYSANPNLYYGDDQDVTSGVGTTYGDVVATTAGAPCSQMNDHLVFGATAGLTVPAGIYSAVIGFIATGTF